MALDPENFSLVEISIGAKLSAIDTTTYRARTMARYITTAFTFIGISIAVADPFSKPSVSSAYATNLQVVTQKTRF